MSLEDFITARKKEIEGKIPLSKVYTQNTFVDCKACDHVRGSTEGNGFFCSLTDSVIPEQIVPLGCDKGKEDDVPFFK